MSCLHKFHEYLTLTRLDFQPTTLIVGTFNPSWPAGNKAEWFYGRTSNNYFWDVLPRLYGEDSLINATPTDWKAFCKRNKIAITDLIISIDDAEEGNTEHETLLSSYSDKNIATKFKKHTTISIDEILGHNNTIQNIYLTRSALETFWKTLWKPVIQYSKTHQIHEAQLLTPSGNAFFQHGNYNRKYPEKRIEKLSDFILTDWQGKWHKI